MHYGRIVTQFNNFYRTALQQIRALPAVESVAVGTHVPWRDASEFTLEFSPDGRAPSADQKPPRATYEVVSPGLFATLGLPLIEGRDFSDADRAGAEPVALVSQSLAQQMFPNGRAHGHYVTWTDQMLQF